MKINQFIKIISNSLNSVANTNSTLAKDNFLISDIQLNINFSTDNDIKNIKMAHSSDMFMDGNKKLNYFKMQIVAKNK